MSDDQDIITLDSDDEADMSAMADLVVGPTGTAMPISEAARLNFQAGMSSSAIAKPPPSLSLVRSLKLPKKPGVLPPFALFSQEHRDQVIQEYKDISFTDVGKKMGELWHTLSEQEKEDYRKRAKAIGDKKLRDWHHKMKEVQGLDESQINAAIAMSQKRRRTHGYAIFSSETRKKLPDNVPASEGTKMIAEQWRNASPSLRQMYEARAARINEAEARKYQGLLLQTHRRQQIMLHHHQQQQQFHQRMMSNHSPASPGQPNLKISSVSSLANQPPVLASRGVSLPSSITISRVQSETPKQNFPPGLSVQRLRGPPPLLRGGMSQQLQQQQQRNMMAPQHQRLLQHRQLQMQLAQQQQRQQLNFVRQGGLSLHLAGIKRPNQQSQILSEVPAKVPRPIAPKPESSSPQIGLISSSRLCRVCGKSSPYNFLLREKPDVIDDANYALGLGLLLEFEDGYPDTVCRKCTSIVKSFATYKKAVESGQSKLKTIAEARIKKRMAAATEESQRLPDDDDSKAFIENQAESLEDELEKLQSRQDANKNEAFNAEPGPSNDFSNSMDDQTFSFIKVSEVRGSFSEGLEDDAIEIEEHSPEGEEVSDIIASQVNANNHETSPVPETGRESDGDVEENAESCPMMDDELELEEYELNSEDGFEDVEHENPDQLQMEDGFSHDDGADCFEEVESPSELELDEGDGVVLLSDEQEEIDFDGVDEVVDEDDDDEPVSVDPVLEDEDGPELSNLTHVKSAGDGDD